jgi:hypothetical protein
MTARQAETILMLSDFLEKRPSGDSKHCEDRESEANVMKTLCSNLQCLFVLWLKALQVYLL